MRSDIKNNTKDDNISDFFEKQSTKNKHRIFWKALYDQLSNDEADSIDRIMETTVLRPGQEIYKQGEFKRALYLLERGQAKHIYTHHGRERFIKKVKPGDVIGDENFFEGGCFTTTVVAMEPVRVRILSEKKLREIGYYDDFEGRLKGFCTSKESIQSLLNQNALDRRQYDRFPLKGLALIKDVEGMTILNSSTLKGQTRDISCGGVCVSVNLAGIYQARILAGHNFKLRFNLPPNMIMIDRIGQVLAGKILDDNDFSPEGGQIFLLNIKFTEPVEKEIISEYSSYYKMLTKSQLLGG